MKFYSDHCTRIGIFAKWWLLNQIMVKESSSPGISGLFPASLS